MNLDTIGRMLKVSSLVQLLFDRDTLLFASPEAERLFPDARPGAAAAQILGAALTEYHQYKGAGSLLFTATLGGKPCDVVVAGLEGYQLVTITVTSRLENASTMLALAQELRRVSATLMVIMPRLFPLAEPSPSKRAIAYASEMNRNVYNLLRTVENLELYAEKQYTARRERTNVTAFLQDLADQLEPLLEFSGHTLEYLHPAKDCYCPLNREQVEYALLNLISNAVKFSPGGGKITLSLQRSAGYISISVRDRGSGIPADQMGHILQRGEHHGQIPDAAWGIGLGLPVARNVAQAHSGRLMLKSIENRGTTVYLSLSTKEDEMKELIFREPVMRPVMSNGINQALVALSDVLPANAFHPYGTDG